MVSPLHMAAGKGHLEVCCLIMENLQNKNPVNGNGDTPLHRAASGGHTDVCRLILGEVNHKNPANKSGCTP